VTRRLPISLTVASYNIHKGRGLDRRVDIRRIAAVLGEIDGDLVGIQEVHRPQVEALADELGMAFAMGVTSIRAGGPYGNAILSRLPLGLARAFDLTRQRREPRGGIQVEVTVGGRPLHLFNVHLGLGVRERAQQVALLVRQHIRRDGRAGPRIVMGDLNEWFPGSVGRALRRELHGPRHHRTHPSPLPLFALDRIYWERDIHAERFHVHRSRLALVASDHLPVVARLRVPAPGGARS
jgi:endonuclease/exonuclease/phosphatase family metal-dependent hydrolase